MLLMFQISKIEIYNVEKKTTTRFDLDAPINYYTDLVCFIYQFNVIKFRETLN
jgi:hypothetical protein